MPIKLRIELARLKMDIVDHLQIILEAVKMLGIKKGEL
jgi:hypothetical protein